jgi:hypothetical protein
MSNVMATPYLRVIYALSLMHGDKSAFGTKKIVKSCSTLSLSYTLATAIAFHNLFLVFFFPNAKLKKKKSFPFWAEWSQIMTKCYDA